MLPKWMKCSTVVPLCCTLLMLLFLYEFAVVKGPEWNTGKRLPPNRSRAPAGGQGGGGGNTEAHATTGGGDTVYGGGDGERGEVGGAKAGQQQQPLPLYEYELDLNEYRLAVEYYETLTGVPRDVEGEEPPTLAPGAFRAPGFAKCVRTAEVILGSKEFCDMAWTSVLRMGRVDMVADTILLVPTDSEETNTLLVLQDPRKPVLELEGLECGQCGLLLKAEVAPFVAVAVDRVLDFYRASPVSLREVDLPWIDDTLATLLSVEPDLDVTASRHTTSISLTWPQYLSELGCHVTKEKNECHSRLGVKEWVVLAVFDYLMGNRIRTDADNCRALPEPNSCVRRMDNVFWTMEDKERLVLINNHGDFDSLGDPDYWIDGIQRWPISVVNMLEKWAARDFGRAVLSHVETHYPLVWKELLCQGCRHDASGLARLLTDRMLHLVSALHSRRDAFMLRIVADSDLE